jgi:tetratricopeptide (TPR) repeat protein
MSVEGLAAVVRGARRSPVALAALLLAAAILAVYGQVVSFDFVAWDDDVYVAANPRVQQGLTLEGVIWAFAAREAWNWHPLTWISHMLDVSLFGLGPAGHHATNLALHTGNALLLLATLSRLTGAPWRSALVAALFALHPLNAGSVAHVAERKGLLAAALGLLAIRAHAGYARRGGAGRYLAVVLCLALGLMAKPVLVTLPLLLLVLDLWPLRRAGSGAPGRAVPVWRLVAEKLPLLALALLAGAATLVAQREAIEAVAGVPLPQRAANAAVACVSYLALMLWPSGLSILHPHPYLPGGEGLPAWRVAGALLLLGALSGLALRGAVRRPWAIAGWLWFLLLLAPTLGLVQVGEQAMAERYFYLPGIGLFLGATWGAAEAVAHLAPRHPRVRPGAAAAALAILGALALRAGLETRPWRESVALFQRTLENEPRSAAVRYNLAAMLAFQGRREEAAAQFEEFLRLRPGSADAYRSLGRVRGAQGRREEAIAAWRRALELDPDQVEAHNLLGNALQDQGDLAGAIAHYERALELEPDRVDAHYNLGNALQRAGRLTEAIARYQRALELEPGYALAHNNLGAALEARGDLEGAIWHYGRAVESDPSLATPRENLESALAARGRAAAEPAGPRPPGG